MRRQVELFATLLLFWVFLNGSFSPAVLAIGALVAFVIAVFSRDGMSFLTDFRLTPAAAVATLRFVLYFLSELVRANFKLARIVLSPSLPIKPGFVKVRTRLKSRMARLFLANSITLTPGTLTVELEDEWLYVHWVNVEADDIEAATHRIVDGFERYLEVMYG